MKASCIENRICYLWIMAGKIDIAVTCTLTQFNVENSKMDVFYALSIFV